MVGFAFARINLGFVGTCVATMRTAFPRARVRYWTGERLFPPMVTVVHADYMIVLFDSSQTSEQIFLQVLALVQRPVDCGGFGTTLVWNQQAQIAFNRLGIEGGNSDNPALFVGHSYGGAAAMVAAANLRLRRRDRVIRFLAMGSPKPGDFRLRNLLELPTRGVALANDDDFIPGFPPGYPDLLAVEIAMVLNLSNFGQWYPPRETWLQNRLGVVSENQYVTLGTQEIVNILRQVITTGQIPNRPSHLIREYYNRITLRCLGLLAPAMGGIA